jgi:hypothetical protein
MKGKTMKSPEWEQSKDRNGDMPLYDVIGRIGKSGASLTLCPSIITLVYIPHIDRHKYKVQLAFSSLRELLVLRGFLHNV